MASRASLIQSRSIYVGTLNSVAPSDGNLIVTGNVGIGTTAPSSILHVDGVDPYVRINNVNSGNNQGIKISYNYSDTHGFHLSYNANGAGAYIDNTYPITSGQAWGDIYFRQNNGTGTMLTRMTIKADGGNVGIGTTSPTQVLNVVGNGRFDAASGNRYVEVASSTSSIQIGTDGTTQFIYGVGAFPMIFSTNGSEKMRITSAGNVGVGTTSPAYTLDVSGTARITTGTYLGTSSGNVIVGGTTSDLIGGFKFIAIGNTAVQYGASTGTYLRIESGAADTEVALKADARSGAYPPMTLYTSGSEKMRITAAGNVGIGTTAPTYKLSVQSTDTAGATGTGATLQLLSDTTAVANKGGSVIFGDAGNAIRAMIKGMYIGPAGSGGGLAFSTAEDSGGAITERMRLNSTGNVGIGTASPGHKLDVGGSININNISYAYKINDLNVLSVSANYTSLHNPEGAISIYLGDSGDRTNYYDNNFHRFRTAGGSSDYMFINSNGNVGIGTTSPSGKLHIAAPTGTASPGSIALAIRDAGSPTFGFDFNLEGVTTGDLSLMRTVSGVQSQVMTFDRANGNVGIGTTGPAAKLNVATSSTWGTAVTEAITIDNTGSAGDVNLEHSLGRIRWRTNGAIGAAIDAIRDTPGAGNNVDIAFFTNTGGSSSTAAERMRINYNGNVGIGTTSPQQRLMVASPSDTSVVLGASYLSTNNNNFFEVGINANDGYLNLRNSGVSTTVHIDSDGNSYLNGGNVGIGTTSPGTRLSIQNSGTTDSIISEYRMTNGSNAVTFRTDDNVIFGIHAQNSGDIYIKDTSDNVLFYGKNGGNVGIGTTAPAQKLHVAGASIIANSTSIDPDAYVDQMVAGLIQDGSGWSAKGFGGNAGTGDSWAIAHSGGALYFGIGNGTAVNSMASYIEVTPSRDITFNGQVRITSGGNVGIGTTNPTVPLQIVKDNATITMTNTTAFAVDTGSRLFLGGKYDTAGTTSPFAWIVGAKENATDGNQAGYLSITTVANGGGFAERMRVTSAGNVGIGTTAPGEKLTIFGPGTGGSGDLLGLVYNSVNDRFVLATEYVANNDGNLQIKKVDGAAGSPKVLMHFDNSGNVGIGTTAPGAKLHVAGDGRFEGSLDLGHGSASEYSLEIGASRTGDGFAYVDLIGDTTYPDYGLRMIRNNGGANTSSAITHRGTGSLLIETNEAAPIVFNTLAAERMRILSGGNVGIGTTTPTNRLTVTTATNAVDVLRLNNTGGDSGAVQGVTHLAINHFNGGTNPSTRITAYQDSTSGWPGGMYFSTRSLNTDSAPLERMRITSAGNIGIGTTSPQYLLDVNGDAQINAQGSGPDYAYVPDGAFGVDSLLTSGSENVALGEPDVWLRIHVDGVAFVFPGYQEP